MLKCTNLLRTSLTVLGWGVALCGFGAAQTQVDLRTQAKSVDFSRAASTKPFRLGTALGSQCSLGETFFKTDAPAGENLYVCAAENTWVLQSAPKEFTISRTPATVLTIGAECSALNPCNVRLGGVTYNISRPCTATLSSGTGTAYVFIADDGSIAIGHNMGVSASAGCAALTGVTAFPPDSIPLYSWTATNGSWDEHGGRDFRAALSSTQLSAGSGVAIVTSGARRVISIDTAVVPGIGSGSATIDFPSIPARSCSGDQTIVVYGAVPGDPVEPAWPVALEAGLVGSMRVTATNSVAARLCNVSDSAVDPASGSYGAAVVKRF